MFAVTVSLRLYEGTAQTFMPLLKKNARQSLENEPGCIRFDICSDPQRPEDVFLYELYETPAAFQVHLKTQHFLTFDRETAAMVAEKTIATFETVVS
jgi:autoinducer 2-degrading protein